MTLATRAAAPTMGDGELVDLVRRGDRSAYGILYARHHAMALRFARGKSVNRADADDIVAEVFASVLQTIENGGGPVGTFAPYLMTCVRNECYRVNRRRAQELPNQQPTVGGWGPTPAPADDPYVRIDESDLVREAFVSLPPRFRDVLWHADVNDESYDVLAPRYRASPRAVAMLVHRARRALGTAYLARHLGAETAACDVDPECRDVRPHLASLVRASAGHSRRRKLERHLQHCEGCRSATASLGRINEHLRSVPLAAVLGADMAASKLMSTSAAPKLLGLGWIKLGAASAGLATVGLAVAVGAHEQPELRVETSNHQVVVPTVVPVPDGPGGIDPARPIVASPSHVAPASPPQSTPAPSTTSPPVGGVTAFTDGAAASTAPVGRAHATSGPGLLVRSLEPPVVPRRAVRAGPAEDRPAPGPTTSSAVPAVPSGDRATPSHVQREDGREGRSKRSSSDDPALPADGTVSKPPDVARSRPPTGRPPGETPSAGVSSSNRHDGGHRTDGDGPDRAAPGDRDGDDQVRGDDAPGPTGGEPGEGGGRKRSDQRGGPGDRHEDGDV